MHYSKDFYYITDDKRKIINHITEVEKLLKQAYWASKRDSKTIQKSIENSICYGVFDAEQDILIGFARTVTDFATMYYLTDVIIASTYRGQGIGKCLLEQIVNDVRFNGMYSVLLTKDAESFYKKYGFIDAIERCMIKLID